MTSSGLGDNRRSSYRETRITVPVATVSYELEERASGCTKTKIASYITCSVFVCSAIFVGFWAAFNT